MGLRKLLQRLVVVGITLLPGVLGGACSGDDKPAPLPNPAATGGVGGTGAPRRDASRDAPIDTSVGGADASSETGGSAGAGGNVDPANCGNVVCRGHGKCQVIGGRAACICDQGYVLQSDAGDTCVVDEKCIKIRFLDDACRQMLNGPPAVGLFFAVDYCAGTAVLPNKLGDLSQAFRVFESGIGDAANVESSFRVVPRDVENYVTIAIDVSTSITNDPGLLSALTRELRTFVTKLTPGPGGQPVGVSVLVFGRFVAEYVAPTTNLPAVDAALARIESAPLTVQALVGGDGTALYEATKKAIRSTERMQRLRSLVTDAGVLTTGVAVIVTDGRESTNATLDKVAIEQTLVNVISIGVSSDINDVDLNTIGRDGSFLAPTIPDMTRAFTEIAQRVDEAPDRAYLLAYCSSATTGSPSVTITTRNVVPKTTAGCKFNAEIFSSDPADRCNEQFFANYCNGKQCGGLLACGACSNSQCCGGDSQCHGPTASILDCRNQDDLCEPEGKVCVRVGSTQSHTCQTPATGTGLDTCGATAANAECDLGRAYCESSRCLPVLANGDVCETDAGVPKFERCPGLNCSRPNPENAFEAHECRPRARMFDQCDGTGAKAFCERGASCRSNTCLPRKPIAASCTTDNECRAGQCFAPGHACVDTAECFFNWNDKMQP